MRNFLKERETKPSGLSSGWRGLTIKKIRKRFEREGKRRVQNRRRAEDLTECDVEGEAWLGEAKAPKRPFTTSATTRSAMTTCSCW